MPTTTVAAIRRCGSRVAASDMTTNVTWPGLRRLMPSLRDMMRQPGGKMLETRTRLQAAMPAERSASSNDVSFSLCLPTPFVKNISFGTRLNTAVHPIMTVTEQRRFPTRLRMRLDAARRLIAMIRSPRATLTDVIQRPRSADLGALIIAIVLVCSVGFLMTDVGRLAALDQEVRQLESVGTIVSDQLYAELRHTLPYRPFVTAAAI